MRLFYRVPDEIRKHYLSWKSDTVFGRNTWLESAVKSEEIYYNDVQQTGTNFTREQKANIENTTGIPVSINFIHPVTNQKLALLMQTKPSMKVISTDGRAKDHAFILDKILHAVLLDSNSVIATEQTIKDSLVSGMGCSMTVPTDFYKTGQFKTQIRHVPFDEVILDINAKQEDLTDMEGFFIEKEFTLPKAIHLYKHILDELVDENGQKPDLKSFTGETWVEQQMTEKAKVTTSSWNADYRVRIREYYTKVYSEMYIVPNPETELNEHVFAENLPEEDLAILNQAIQKVPDIYIKKTICMGDFVIFEEILPITEYPLQVTFFEWGGKPYRSYGMVHFTKDMQQAYDKVMQIMIMNGILSNNAGWSGPKGSIAEEDRRKWEDFANNPMVYKEYVPKIVGNEVLIPQKDSVTQLSNFYPLVLEMLKGGIEYSTGVSAILQGNAGEAGVDVFSSLQQYQNAAMQRVMLASQHVNQMMARLGKVAVEYIVSNITAGDFYFFDDKGYMNELKITKEVVNNLKIEKFLTTVVPAPAMATQRLASATELMKIAQSSPDPAERSILTQKAMELSDIREYETVQDQLDITKRTQGQLESLQEAYDRLMETSKQMENKYINVELQNRIYKELLAREQNLAKAYGKAEGELGKDIKDIKDKEKENK